MLPHPPVGVVLQLAGMVATWIGSSNKTQLISLVKIKLSSKWRNTLADYKWEDATLDGLYVHMDQKLEVLFPPLKRAVSLLTSLKKSPQETHLQYLERVKSALIVGGIGTRTSFNLSWDKLTIKLVIKGLSNADQCKIFCCFDIFNISMDNLN